MDSIKYIHNKYLFFEKKKWNAFYMFFIRSTDLPTRILTIKYVQVEFISMSENVLNIIIEPE